ncbi:MAG: molybdopterin-dependent oxidoreductase [Desulfurococcaceae archaeon]|nr:molybdopterin-dependent oxidoreductase [Desulfurococcaceae archaeon]
MPEQRLTRRDFIKLATVAGLAIASGITVGATGLQKVETLKYQPERAKDMLERVKRGEVTVKYTACVMCAAECALEVWVKDGKVIRIYGNPHVHYNSGGAACAKGVSGINLQYSPYRIHYPLKRVGERGEGKFIRISWEQAIDEIAKKLVEIKKKYGPEAVLMDTGDVTDRDQYWRLFFAFGTPNCVEHGAICDTPRRHGPKLAVEGKRWEPDIMRPVPVRMPDGSIQWYDKHDAKLIIYIGWNPFTATRIVWETIGTVRAKVENGCKVYVVDPGYSNTAALADKWFPIRPGTDADLAAAMLRYILEHDNPNDPNRRYIDREVLKYVEGWEEFIQAFKEWWDKVDPATGKKYFTLEWAEARTGLRKEDIEMLAHEFGITKPAAVIWGMQAPGHHYNGYVASILFTFLNVITGNFERPGGVIDTEIVKSSKGGTATGRWFNDREVERVINGRKVRAKQVYLHYAWYGDWPAAWDDVVGDLPRMIREGITLRYGPFRGHKYPLAAYILRTGNTLVTAGPIPEFVKAFTEKKPDGTYKLELFVVIDTIFLESALYADYVLPEASYLERMSLSDIYPTHPVIFLRDAVVEPMFEAKKPTDIMNMLAKKIYEYELKEFERSDIDPKEFWEKYKTEEDFVNEMLLVAPGRPNVGRPLPYPNLPEGYTLYGTPESLEEGRVTIDHKGRVVRGEPVTVEYLRKHYGAAIWPMSWYRYKVWDPAKEDWVPGGVVKTKTGKIEFKFYRYERYNKLVEEAGEVPPSWKEVGWSRLPMTFYWFETVWNPYTNPAYAKYKDEYPFLLCNARVHHAMSGTHMCEWLAQTPAEGLWLPLSEPFEALILEPTPGGKEFRYVKKRIPKNMWGVGVAQINRVDAEKYGIKTGDLIVVENPLGRRVVAKAYVCETVRPGVIRMGFATGGRFAPGLGGTYHHRIYTPNHNELVDYKFSPIMGEPAYGNMIVKIKKVKDLEEARKLLAEYYVREYKVPGVGEGL